METKNRVISKIAITDTLGTSFKLKSVTRYRNGKVYRIKMYFWSRLRMYFYAKKVLKMKNKCKEISVYMDGERVW